MLEDRKEVGLEAAILQATRNSGLLESAGNENGRD